MKLISHLSLSLLLLSTVALFFGSILTVYDGGDDLYFRPKDFLVYKLDNLVCREITAINSVTPHCIIK